MTAENRALKNMVESLEITVRNQPTKIAESMAVAFMDVLVQRGVISTTTALESSAANATANAVESTTSDPATSTVECATNDDPHAETVPSGEDAVTSDDVLNGIIQLFRRNLEELEKNDDQNALQWKDLPNVPNSNRHLYIRELLEEMVNVSNVLLPHHDSLLENATLPPSVQKKNSGKFKCAMKLVQSVLTNEQKQMLALPKKKRQEIIDFPQILKAQLYCIEKNAVKKMRELDQKSRTTTATMLGLGNRYEEYLKKNNIKNEAKQPRTLTNFFTRNS